MKKFSVAEATASGVPALTNPPRFFGSGLFGRLNQPGRLGLSLLLALGLLFQFIGPALAAPDTTADRVYGQGGLFTTGNANNGGLSANGLSLPYNLAVDSAGGIYVADTLNNRVLHYPSGSTTADRVYGQGGAFNTSTANKGGLSANSLNFPAGVAIDSAGGIYVGDASNNRVLHYPSGSTTADRVYGQGGAFNTNTINKGGLSANSLNFPNGVAVDSTGGIYVGDRNNNRVLHYPSGSTTADRVYGQGGAFNANVGNNGGLSANSLNFPYGAAVDSTGGIYVADASNNRVLHYPSGSTTADRVYGQGGAFNNASSSTTANGLSLPLGVTIDSAGGIYVADASNNRVLHYPSGSTTADVVYGQGGAFTTNTSSTTANGLSLPFAVAIDSAGGIYVADRGNNRVLYFSNVPPPTLTVSPTTLSYTATAGGTNPAAQNVAVGNLAGTSGPLDWSVGAISYGPGGTGWLSCTPASGTNQASGTSTNVSCQPTTGALVPGTYTASFNVTSATPGVIGSPKTVNVTFVVQTPPTLTVTPTTLSYTATAGGANPAAQNVTIGNIAGANAALDWNVGAATYGPGGTGWLTCTPASGTNLAAGTTTNVSCQPTTGALTPGTYTASFDVTSATPNVAGSPKTVNVTFVVETPPTLTVSPTNLSYTATQRGANPAAQNVTIGNLAGANGPLDWNLSVSYPFGQPGGSWLNCTPASGTNQAAGTSTNVSCQPVTSGLFPGTYTARLDISSTTPGVAGSPRTVNVTFVVETPPTLTISPNSLSYTATAGGANPAAQNIAIGNLMAANGPLDWNVGPISYGSGPSGWLSCTPTSGTGQAAGTSTNVSCQPVTGALTPGTYTAQVFVSATSGDTGVVNISFTVQTPPTLTVTPTSLNFGGVVGGSNPAAQNITIGNIAGANASLDWNVGAVTYGPGATGWLNCTPASGTGLAAGTTTNTSCQPTTGALAAGTYTASFDVTSPTPGVVGSPKTVNVTFVLNPPPTLTVTPTNLSYTATAGGANPAAQNITIGNIAGANGPLDWNVGAVSYGPGGTGWLTCTPASGTNLAAGATTNVSCQPTTGALSAGTYTASFDITSATPGVAGSPKTVNISFAIQNPPTLTVSPTSLNYTATAGGANPAAQNVAVGNIAGANVTLDWSVGAISYGPGGTGWLSCTPTTGTGQAAGTTTAVSCQPTTGALSAGTYTASFDVTSATPGAAGSPKTVSISFTVDTPPTLTVTPTSLNFAAQSGGANPAAQNVTIGNLAAANKALDWNLSAITYGAGGTGWLSCTPTSGMGQKAGTTTDVSCQPTTGALAVGTYTASFQVTSSTPGVAGSPQTVNVTFTVAQGPVLTVTPTSLSFAAQTGGANPAAQNVTVGNLAGANGPLDWSLSAISYGPGGNSWLTCTPGSGTNLAAGSSTTVSCQAATGVLTVGTYTASFQVTSATPGVTGSPKTVSVSFTISATPPPPPSATPGYGSTPAPGSTWQIGKSKVGQSVSANLAINETGGAALTVSNPVLGGANAAEFTVTNAASFPLNIADGGAAQNLTVQCKPAALGARTATLTLTTNDPAQPTVSYSLVCNGVKEERNPIPADLIGQLRITPDRIANLDSSTLITVSFKLTNVGPGRADSVRLTFPLDPNLVVGYTSFGDSRMWVSELVSQGEKPYLRVGLPSVEPKQSFSGQIVFRPAVGATDKAKVMLRYLLGWDDDEAAGKQAVSNGVRFILSSEASRNESGGEVQQFEPGARTIPVGTNSIKLSADFYASNEIVTLWYTDASGKSFQLGQQYADREGKLSFEVATAGLSAGQTYTIVGYGNRSGVSGSSAVTVTAP